MNKREGPGDIKGRATMSLPLLFMKIISKFLLLYLQQAAGLAPVGGPDRLALGI